MLVSQQNSAKQITLYCLLRVTLCACLPVLSVVTQQLCFIWIQTDFAVLQPRPCVYHHGYLHPLCPDQPAAIMVGNLLSHSVIFLNDRQVGLIQHSIIKQKAIPNKHTSTMKVIWADIKPHFIFDRLQHMALLNHPSHYPTNSPQISINNNKMISLYIAHSNCCVIIGVLPALSVSNNDVLHHRPNTLN